MNAKKHVGDCKNRRVSPEVRKVAGYVRVSTDDQADNGISLEAQESAIRAWCKSQGHALLTIYGDPGISAARADNRPGLQDALKDAKKHKAVLVVYSLSRLTRSLKDSITIVEQLQQHGAAFVSLTEDFDTTSANGDFVFNIMASVAQLERKQTGERTRAAMAQLKKQGRRISGRIPYGYDLAKDGRHLVLNVREQEVIQVMREFREKGLSYRAIAGELNRCRIPSKLGGRWGAQSVRRVLSRFVGS